MSTEQFTEDERIFFQALLFSSPSLPRHCPLCGVRGPFMKILGDASSGGVLHFRGHYNRVPQQQRDAFVALVATGVDRWHAWPELFGCEIGDSKWQEFWKLPDEPLVARDARVAKIRTPAKGKK